MGAELKMDMADTDAVSHMENLFFLYPKVLGRNGIAWILEEDEKIAMGQVLSAIRPYTFQELLRVNLEFSRAKVKKDLIGFFDHVLDRSEAWQQVEILPKHDTMKRFPRHLRIVEEGSPL